MYKLSPFIKSYYVEEYLLYLNLHSYCNMPFKCGKSETNKILVLQKRDIRLISNNLSIQVLLLQLTLCSLS